LIYKISSTCFGQYFAHLQERKTEIFTAYGILQRWILYAVKISVLRSWRWAKDCPNEL